MDRETYGVWCLKRDPSQYFIVDSDKWIGLGPFPRHIVPRVYLKANSWMMDGDELGPWNYGFVVLFGAKPMPPARQELNPVDARGLFPCLTFYTWPPSQAISPIDWAPGKISEATFLDLKDLLKNHAIEWRRDQITAGVLTEDRNWHHKGAQAFSTTQQSGTSFCIVDNAPHC